MKENEIENENENENKLIVENKDDENVKLISESEKEEKNHLIKIFKRLETDLEKNNNESINDVYEEYLNNEDITKRNIKKNTKNSVIYFMYYFISPAFAIINLIGIYQVITIMNVLMTLLKQLITEYYKMYFYENYEPKKDLNLNYYDLFYKNSYSEIFEFNLTMIMDFLGIIVLKSRGFRIASIIFMIINLISLFLIASFDFSKFDFENNRKMSFLHILYLLLCYILLFVGVGSSALLSEQILIDSEEKYNKYLIESEKKELEKEEKTDSKYMNRTKNIEEELKEDKKKENHISMNNLITSNPI